MNGRVDLHVHSSHSSDGDFPPAALLRMAKESGLRAISIADHDTVEAYPDALEDSEKAGVELIPSIELTTLYERREFHLLLPFVRWTSPTLKRILATVTCARMEEAKERVARLKELGFEIDWDEVIRETKGRPPLGVSIAQILIDKGRKKKIPSLQKYYEGENRLFAPYFFYKDYFLEEGPAFVPKRTVSLLDVLDLMDGDGAVPVLAHPGAYFERATKEDLAVLKGRGLVGLEVYSSYHDAGQIRMYKAVAEEMDLVVTAGSDFHGRIKPHVVFGRLREGTYRMVEELKARRRG
ncbi:MAG: PHP domain-containing protein [Candidatus Aminicenantes bacterium]|nr:PHP domain-containing protein [Candidatus Aminicenantes bacterium]